MKTLQEALSKSMIDKLEKHEYVLTEFTKDDLENGDLLIDESDHTIWMYLDNEEVHKRINEFKDFTGDIFNKFKNGSGFLVKGPNDTYYIKKFGIFRIPIYITEEKDNILIYNKKIFYKLIKCHKKYLDNSISLNTIYKNNRYFEKYL